MESIQISLDSAPPSQPPEVADLGNIAVSCSGGGYRTSAYHLGTLEASHCSLWKIDW